MERTVRMERPARRWILEEGEKSRGRGKRVELERESSRETMAWGRPTALAASFLPQLPGRMEVGFFWFCEKARA